MDELYGIPEMPDQDDIDYMGDAITPLQAKAEEVSQAFGFTEQLILDFLHRLYDGKLDPKQEIDAPMWEQVRTVLREAVAKGYDEPKCRMLMRCSMSSCNTTRTCSRPSRCTVCRTTWLTCCSIRTAN
jgi:hypothetical protein